MPNDKEKTDGEPIRPVEPSKPPGTPIEEGVQGPVKPAEPSDVPGSHVPLGESSKDTEKFDE